jgi:hypothetical protein
VADGREAIGEPVGERGFGADDRQIDALAIDEPNDRVGVQEVDGRGGDGAGDAGVTGRAHDVGNGGVGRECGRERMFTRAGAENEDPQGSNL